MHLWRASAARRHTELIAQRPSVCAEVAAEALAEASKTAKNQQLGVVLPVTLSQSQAQPPKHAEPALSSSLAVQQQPTQKPSEAANVL